MKQISKLSLSNFSPDKILTMDKAVQEVRLGVLIGRATGIVERKDPKDPDAKFTGLSGKFECYFDAGGDGKTEEPISSGVLFIPDAFQNPIEDLLSDVADPKTGEITQPAADAVQIGFEVYAIRATNPRGRSWMLRAIEDPEVEKPVDLIAGLRERALAQLNAPVEQAQIEAPKKGK